jgi:alkanesulfonate monooxygenase SsuD/methylene tetrahydromethanopterin reductase-like flavin-dependent oxidoreductase (luciferase family)
MTLVALTAPQFSRNPEPLFAWAAFLEEAGLDGGFLFDHLVPIGDATRPVLEMAGALGALSAATSTIDIGTLVMRAPLRGEVLSAAVAATAAAVAPGRVVVGLGAGDRLSGEEAERFGMPHGGLDERVGTLRETALRIGAACPDVRVWVGGTHPRVIEVAAQSASGWNGWMLDPGRVEEIRSRLPGTHEITWGGAVITAHAESEVQRLVDQRGGPRGAIAGTIDEVAAELRRYVAAGAQRLLLSMLPNRVDQWALAVELKQRLA